jgi:acetolactate synthase-1/2/3 large subunit
MITADYISRFLQQQGIPCVFELVGGMITCLLDSLHRQGRIRIVTMHHEQAAGFAAEAVGRLTGVPGVALATSGPGATNLLTAIGSCYFDSSPAVFITGQVNRNEQKGPRAIRQQGFQETDIVSMAKPITKGAWQVREARDVLRLLGEAFQLARAGRPGPVLLDIPMDVQREEIPDTTASCAAVEAPTAERPDAALIAELLGALSTARRPLILAGGGLRSAHAVELFRTFVAKTRVPVVYSLMGVDALPFGDPLRVGMIGTYGNRWANLALGRADLLLVLGSRLDVRQTGSDLAAFKGDRAVYHVDIDPEEINNRVRGCRGIVSGLREFLAGIQQAAEAVAFPDWSEWVAEIASARQRMPDTAELDGVPGINPNGFMHELSRTMTAAAAYVVDVGQNQMWAAQSLEVHEGQRFLTSGGMGSMGFALPAGVGAALALPGRPVVVIAGDGGFQCNIQELQTVIRNRLPLKMVVIDNGCLGMVRQFQQCYFEGRYQSTLWGYSAPDFTRVAAAYGISARTVKDPGEVSAAVKWLQEEGMSPALLQVVVDPMANAYPKIAFGKPITEMEPETLPV